MMYQEMNEVATRPATGSAMGIRTLASIVRYAGVLAFMLLAIVATASAQTTNADLSGIIVDVTGARLPKARITLQNDKSKDVRTAVTNKEGVYQFISVPTGTYTMTVKGTGFGTYEETGIELHPGDQRALPDIAMRAGDEASITVSASANDIIESGELSSLISKDDIAHLAVEGRDVTELVKILPGFALQASGGTGLSNVAPNTVGVSLSGQADNYAANGSPEGGVGLISDGSNVQDPGASGAATQTINMDMVEEVKVQTSNFGAESAKGPIVVNAVGKSGGALYHGSAYIIGNAAPLNSQDWITNYFSLTKPQDRYIYPGGNIGGPVRIPGTNFNHNKKLTFFAAGEDYIQKNVFAGGSASSALRLSTVFSDPMRAGNWSTQSLSNWLNVPLDSRGLLTGCQSTVVADSLKLSNFQNVCTQPVGVDAKAATIVNGIINNYDPGGAAYLNIFPHANRVPQPVPNGNITDGYNRTDLYLFDNNLWQAHGRLDYAFSDTTKIYGVYTIEKGQGYGPSSIYYTGGNIIRNPSLNVGDVDSQTGSLDFTKVLNPSMTNEITAAGSYYYNPYHAQNEASQSAAAFNYPYVGLVATGSKQLPQLGYNSGTTLPSYFGPDFTFGPIFSRKQSLDVADTYTWVVRSHTIKLGAYAERIANNQVNAEPTQGSITEYNEGGVTFKVVEPGVTPVTTTTMNPGNEQAQLLLGIASNYQQYTSQPLLDMHYNVLDGFFSDTWKVTKRFTLTYGIRFEHLGPWIDSRGTGLAVWQPQNFKTVLPSQQLTLTTLPGISWHAQNSAIPLSGDNGTAVFYSPRTGFSFDAAGNGRTVIGGGWGAYRSHDSWNDFEGALATSQGSYGISVGNATLHCIDAFGRGLATTTTTAAGGAYSDCTQTETSGANVTYGNDTVVAIQQNDTQQPVSYTYSLSLTQQMPWKSQFKIGYAGSENAHILVRGGSQNINTIPFGGEFGPDPNPNSIYYGQIQAPDSISRTSDYRPYPFYTGIDVLRHTMHTNYNSLQTTWERRTGHFLYMFNYTWSRAEGDLAAIGRSTPDYTNKRNDRGILNYDRTHIFNATFTYILGNIYHRNALIGGVVNGWEISGINNLQSGPNLQSATNSNFGLQSTRVNTQNFTQTVIPGVPMVNTDSQTWLGTPDIQLQPATVCSPATNLAPKQFVNASCLILPQLGQNGPYRLPYLRGPAYFNTDLSVQKSWRAGDKKTIQVRAAGFNFVNHPLTSLVAAGTATPLQLVLSDDPATAGSTGFGRAIYKQGRRVIEITLRYNF